ncbi:MAG: YHS domain-containing protein [Candidatus Odinarchaeum yellowstonii]|uniref:YHS domain-containing protein n=1 Tax=Odinarchaeota yellowstonii (strain LCB_4) TaxID=1841599 RepID=A0AAF0D1S2_ODILC|nr:MAG: YHS domain-containing protein [Candidatus Odinarchaeum yellowstonii]
MVVDPVCGMEFSEKDAKLKYTYGGKVYYFCCEICMEKFIKNPEKYGASKLVKRSGCGCCGF